MRLFLVFWNWTNPYISGYLMSDMSSEGKRISISTSVGIYLGPEYLWMLQSCWSFWFKAIQHCLHRITIFFFYSGRRILSSLPLCELESVCVGVITVQATTYESTSQKSSVKFFVLKSSSGSESRSTSDWWADGIFSNDKVHHWTCFEGYSIAIVSFRKNIPN